MTDNQAQNSPSGSSSEGVRKLAAIMFTDMKDFSKKMQSNEMLMLRILEEHNQIMQRTVQKHRGTVIKTIGDAFLVSFESVVDAVSCAGEAQMNFMEYNKGKPSNEKITVRIGVHLGDVIVKGSDVFGDGVNIASRVQSMAEPGGLNITESVYQQVKTKLDIHVVKLGAPQLKGIKEAIKVYQVILVPEAKRRGKFATNLYVTKTLLKRKRSRQVLGASLLLSIVLVWVWATYFSVPTIKSIAVLPFESLGSTEEYLADGLTEEIIAQLSKIPEILVISKASSFSFKNTNLDHRNVAKQLGVQYLLKGNIRVGLGQVSVVAYLFEPFTGEREWTQTFDIDPKELFQLQYEIPRQIARRFRLQFAAKRVYAIPEVYDLYSRGLFERDKLTRESNYIAIGYFLEALKKDSLFLPARVALAKAQIQKVFFRWDYSEETLVSIEQQCAEVLRLDSTNAEAYAILGTVHIVRGDRERGIGLLKTALLHEPRNYTSLSLLGREYLFNLNDPGAGLSYLQRALESDPANFLLNSNIGVAYAMLKNYTEAIEAFRRASVLNPIHDYPLSNLGSAFERSGQYDSAIVYYRLAVDVNPLREDNYLLLGELHLSQGQFSQAESVFTLGVKKATNALRLKYNLGILYTRQGKHDLARKNWEEALKQITREIDQQPPRLEHLSYAALLSARLNNEADALGLTRRALELDSSDSEVHFNAARVYAVLGRKNEMLEMFKKARSMNPEYDAKYIATSVDFERFRTDPELLSLAR